MTIHDQAAAPSRQIEPIRHDNLLIHFTTEFHRIWDSTGSRAKPAAFWRPTPAPDVLPGYFPLGDVFVAGHDNINGSTVVAVVCEGGAPSADPARGPALRRPEDFELIWKDSRLRLEERRGRMATDRPARLCGHGRGLLQ